jgi:prepilin-type N-terminal cleavage/methylation domain-containing protein
MKGFTLLEILVTILIFGFIVGGIYGVLNIARTNYDTTLVSLNLQRQVRQGMSRLSREIRQANASTIVISTPDANNNNTITFNTPTATGVKYYVLLSSDGVWQLVREYPTDTKIYRANDIKVLSFPARSTGSNIQKITIGASKTFFSGGKSQTLTFSLTEQVNIRNP